MDHVPRSLFFGPPTPGDVQMQADRERRHMSPQMRKRRAEHMATDSQPARAARSFIEMFDEAARIGFA
jgi:hypothetical protein